MTEKLETDFNDKNIKLQRSSNRNITILMNANVRKLATVIASQSVRNTNKNKSLSKAFTKNKRELRNSLTDLITKSVDESRLLADKKNVAFIADVKESVN